MGKRVRDVFPELEEQGFFRLLDEVYRTGQAYRATGAKVSFQGRRRRDRRPLRRFRVQPVRNADDDVTGIFVQANDVTEHKRAERLRGLQNRVLELEIEDCSLADALEQLILAVEAYSSSGMLGSVLLLDSAAHRLRHGAAPNLPSDYNEAIDGIEIGPNVGFMRDGSVHRIAGLRLRYWKRSSVGRFSANPPCHTASRLLVDAEPVEPGQGARHLRDLLSRTAVSRRRRPRAGSISSAGR